jgi:hypothetical protein
VVGPQPGLAGCQQPIDEIVDVQRDPARLVAERAAPLDEQRAVARPRHPRRAGNRGLLQRVEAEQPHRHALRDRPAEYRHHLVDRLDRAGHATQTGQRRERVDGLAQIGRRPAVGEQRRIHRRRTHRERLGRRGIYTPAVVLARDPQVGDDRAEHRAPNRVLGQALPDDRADPGRVGSHVEWHPSIVARTAKTRHAITA